jgi:hypothetical protein
MLISYPFVLLSAAAQRKKPAPQNQNLKASSFFPSKLEQLELAPIPVYVVMTDMGSESSKRKQHTTVPPVEGIVRDIRYGKLLRVVTGSEHITVCLHRVPN